MFTTHTVSTQLANSMKSSQKSLTSGMYLTFYYLGGASGSIIPSYIYKAFGWNIMLTIFIFLIIIVALVVFLIENYLKLFEFKNGINFSILRPIAVLSKPFTLFMYGLQKPSTIIAPAFPKHSPLFKYSSISFLLNSIKS